MGAPARSKRSSYIPPPPSDVQVASLRDLMAGVRTIDPVAGQQSLTIAACERLRSQPLYLAGDVSLLRQPSVAVVGARKSSNEGLRRAARLARELVAAKVVVVSGLAEGVDTAAHTAAIEHKGRTIGVVGTPITTAYPASNAALQEEIYQHHLLISPFEPGVPVRAGNFPQRNRVMAAVSDATVIIEASDTSGTLHQASECTRLGRPLFIAKSVADNASLQWPKRFLTYPNTRILERTEDILEALSRR